MIRLTDELYVGLADDSYKYDLPSMGVGAVLVVASDLDIIPAHKGIEIAKVGLVDGPGNPTSAYCAAVLAVRALAIRHRRVLVLCHGGSRSLAIAVMYHNLFAKRSWAGWLQLLAERVDVNLPQVNDAHQIAFDVVNWRMLTTLAGVQ